MTDEAKRKRTRVSAIEGRVLEEAVIWPGDPDAEEPQDRGPSLELRLSGGLYFSFAAAEPIIVNRAITLLARTDKRGDMHGKKQQREFRCNSKEAWDDSD